MQVDKIIQMVEMAIEIIASRNENLSHMLETPDVLIEVRTHVEIKSFQVRKVARADVTVVLRLLNDQCLERNPKLTQKGKGGRKPFLGLFRVSLK